MSDTRDDDVVISGISGRFPSSNNVREFSENLFNKVDMTDDDESRWRHFHDDVPRRFGKIRNLEKFDASFFSTLNKHANWTDPQMRMLLEHAYEAILDAGISPQSLVGSRTGVFVGCSNSDARDAFMHRYPAKDGYVVLGNANFYMANRVSYALGLCGPSFTVDTACSSSAYALDCAFHYIQSGVCDAALVGGSQLNLNCAVTQEYSKLGILASDGVCRPFDENATGFARADTICMVFLQRQKDAKRVYANVIYSSSNNDGFKREGASFPSRKLQRRLMEDFYARIKFAPEDVGFVEAHATGTRLGDPEELAAIDEVFCSNGNRARPLVVGSVKSNMGHAEAAAGMASIAKILVALEQQKFPPNINLATPRANVPAFEEPARIKVATEAEQLCGEYNNLIAMNSFGLGGGNAHALFRGNARAKVNAGIPCDDLGRMVLWAGRTEDAVNAIFDDIASRPLDAEHVALLQNSQTQTTSANTYRGFATFAHDEGAGRAVCMQRDIQYFSGSRRPIVFVFSGIGSQWSAMGRDLMRLPLFAASIERSHATLLTKNVDLMCILTAEETKFDNILHSYVGIVAIEIALTDTLKALKIEPDFIIGHSVGELGCAYADNCLTAEETILCAFARGEASNETATNAGGAMAAIGLHYSELEELLPPDIDIACHNGADSTTISGPAESVLRFVDEMRAQKVFAKEVACSGIALHSRYITEMGKLLHAKLQKVIQTPRVRSRKWLSSTFAEEAWGGEDAFFSSAAYHTRNLLNPVLFQEVTELLPPNALTIEVAPHALLKSILKRSLPDGLHMNLTQRDNKQGFELFLESLGRLFQQGVDMDIAKLYPAIAFPVSRNTPMISPNIKWNHAENHYVPYYDSYNWYERRNIIININDKVFEPVQGHLIDGRCLFPATGWVFLVWDTFAMMTGMPVNKARVVFEYIQFLRATALNRNQDVLVTIAIHRGTGRFEVIEGVSAVVHGYIKHDDEIEMAEFSVPESDNNLKLETDDFYKEMRLSGFCHLHKLQGIKEIRHDGLEGKIKWTDDWIAFIDSMTHFEEFETKAKVLALPTNIRKIVIDPILHLKMLEEKKRALESSDDDEKKEILYDVKISPYLRIIQAGGVEIHEKKNRVVNRRRPKEPTLESQKFIPFFSSESHDLGNAAKILVQRALETDFHPRFSCLEIDSERAPLSEFVSKAVQGIPLVQSEVTLVTTKEGVELEGVSISSQELSSFNGVDMLIKCSCINDHQFLESAKAILSSHGYIVSRETEISADLPENLRLVARLALDTGEVLHMLQFKESIKQFEPKNAIEITSDVNEWLDPLKTALKEGATLVYAYNHDYSGVLGLFNCIRREYQAERLKCIFIMDTATAPTSFDVNDKFFSSQLALNHSVNVYKDGAWGNYRFLNIKEMSIQQPQRDHCFANCIIRGDLSSLAWIRGPLDVYNDESNEDLIKIQFSSLNFKDVMLALGRILYKEFNRLERQCVLGLEFSGMRKNNQRVMGIGLKAGALATHYDSKHAILWDVPDKWTMEEAATVPLVYFTVYFAFFVTTKIKSGKSILIHSGTGGVGQAAIQVAFAYGLEVFTTVGSNEKREFLLQKFPQLKPENIGNSRNTSFERMVLENTKGIGVDYVLNSLADEKLKASIRCLARDGTLLEIGKYDMLKGTKLDMRHLIKRIKIKAIHFDDLPTDSDEMKAVYCHIDRDLKSGVVQPLNATVFDAGDVEEAFRFMASGKHIGKVLLKVRQNASDESSLPLLALNRIFVNPADTVFIAGGLGGFGMELADWLVLRGCRKLVLSSKRGITSKLQTYKIQMWESYGAAVIVTTEDITSESGCEEALRQASELGPVAAIFNLAVALRDGIFDNLDEKMFDECLAPKAKATRNLDRVSRRLCPLLRHFVVFSSFSCGRGNAGQCNYGLANSVMERIVEERTRLGLPAKAIQWAAVGDVGLLADFQLNNLEQKDFKGTLPQAIQSCLEVLDALLTCEDAVVSSMVVADKSLGAEAGKKGNIIDMILRIMGIRDRKSISMDSTLTQLGIDSLMGVEIQQILERDFDIALTSQELRSLTLAQLEKRVTARASGENSEKSGDAVDEIPWIMMLLDGAFDTETRELLTNDSIVRVNDVEEKDSTKVLILPGYYGIASDIYRNLARQMSHPAFVLQMVESAECTSIEDILAIVQPQVSALYDDCDNFVLVAHSFSVILALALARKLEGESKRGKIIVLDSSPLFCKKYALKRSTDDTDEKMKTSLSRTLFESFATYAEPQVTKAAFYEHEKWEEKLDALLKASADRIPYTFEFIKRNVFTAFINRFFIALNVKEDAFSKLESTRISLIKASRPSVSGMPKDFGLSKYSSDVVNVQTLDGDHVTITINPQLPDIIRNLIAN